MSAIVLDASVASKLFLVEADSAAAWTLLGGGPFFEPKIIIVEIAAAITRQYRLGVFDEDDTRLKLEDARAFMSAPMFSLVADEVLLRRAEEIAIAIRHPLQDCLYLALAEQQGAELITSDKSLLRRAERFHFVRSL